MYTSIFRNCEQILAKARLKNLLFNIPLIIGAKLDFT